MVLPVQHASPPLPKPHSAPVCAYVVIGVFSVFCLCDIFGVLAVFGVFCVFFFTTLSLTANRSLKRPTHLVLESNGDGVGE
jgi:hypothetical protein